MEDSGLFQSLNIEAYVKTNETDESASVDVIVREIRNGEEMHNKMKALGHNRHRFIKTTLQTVADVKTKNYTEASFHVSCCPSEGAAACYLSYSSSEEPHSELCTLTSDALQMQNGYCL